MLCKTEIYFHALNILLSREEAQVIDNLLRINVWLFSENNLKYLYQIGLYFSDISKAILYLDINKHVLGSIFLGIYIYLKHG